MANTRLNNGEMNGPVGSDTDALVFTGRRPRQYGATSISLRPGYRDIHIDGELVKASGLPPGHISLTADRKVASDTRSERRSVPLQQVKGPTRSISLAARGSVAPLGMINVAMRWPSGPTRRKTDRTVIAIRRTRAIAARWATMVDSGMSCCGGKS